jgi:hypothetical protein
MGSIIPTLFAPPGRKRNGERHHEYGHERNQNHDGNDAQRRCRPDFSKKFQGEVEHATILPARVQAPPDYAGPMESVFIQ